MPLDQLIKQCQAGDENAFGELLGRYYDTIYATAWRWCGDQTNAEDITQNACLKLANNIGKFDGSASFTTWLYRLTINCAKDFYKSPSQHNQREQGLDDFEQVMPATHDESARIDAQRMLVRIGELASDLADTLLLVFVQGLNHREAAAQLSIKESTVSWRIHEARKQLKLMVAAQTPQPQAELVGGQT